VAGCLPCSELANTFNCGIGMVLVVDAGDVEAVLALLEDTHEEHAQIGVLVERAQSHAQTLLEGAESQWLMLPQLGASLPFPRVLSSMHDDAHNSKQQVVVLVGASCEGLYGLAQAAGPSASYELAGVITTDRTLRPSIRGVPCEFLEAETLAATLGERYPAGAGTLFVALASFDRRKLTQDFLAPRGGKVVAVHHSLLPAFPVEDPVSEALRKRVFVTGVTAFVVVPNVALQDSPILAQEVCQVAPGESRDALYDRIRKECENACVAAAVHSLSSGKLTLVAERGGPNMIVEHRARSASILSRNS